MEQREALPEDRDAGVLPADEDLNRVANVEPEEPMMIEDDPQVIDDAVPPQDDADIPADGGAGGEDLSPDGEVSDTSSEAASGGSELPAEGGDGGSLPGDNGGGQGPRVVPAPNVPRRDPLDTPLLRSLLQRRPLHEEPQMMPGVLPPRYHERLANPHAFPHGHRLFPFIQVPRHMPNPRGNPDVNRRLPNPHGNLNVNRRLQNPHGNPHGNPRRLPNPHGNLNVNRRLPNPHGNPHGNPRRLPNPHGNPHGNPDVSRRLPNPYGNPHGNPEVPSLQPDDERISSDSEGNSGELLSTLKGDRADSGSSDPEIPPSQPDPNVQLAVSPRKPSELDTEGDASSLEARSHIRQAMFTIGGGSSESSDDSDPERFPYVSPRQPDPDVAPIPPTQPDHNIFPAPPSQTDTDFVLDVPPHHADGNVVPDVSPNQQDPNIIPDVPPQQPDPDFFPIPQSQPDLYFFPDVRPSQRCLPGPSSQPDPSVVPGPSSQPDPSVVPGPSSLPDPSVVPGPPNQPDPNVLLDVPPRQASPPSSEGDTSPPEAGGRRRAIFQVGGGSSESSDDSDPERFPLRQAAHRNVIPDVPREDVSDDADNSGGTDDEGGEPRRRGAQWRYVPGFIDSCDESPDEEVLNRVEPHDRVLEGSHIRQQVGMSVMVSRAALADYDDSVDRVRTLKQRLDANAQRFETMWARRTFEDEDIDLDFVRNVNIHMSVYRNIFERWVPAITRLLDRIESIEEEHEFLLGRLEHIAEGHLSLEEADHIYRTLENLEGLLQYSDALLKRIMQRGELIERSEKRIAKMLGVRSVIVD